MQERLIEEGARQRVRQLSVEGLLLLVCLIALPLLAVAVVAGYQENEEERRFARGRSCVEF